MKYTLIFTIFLAGCTNIEPKLEKNDANTKIDSIIAKTEQSITILGDANNKSDSVVTGKVAQTVQKIQHLETEVKQLKAENNALKSKINDLDDAGKPYVIKSIPND